MFSKRMNNDIKPLSILGDLPEIPNNLHEKQTENSREKEH